MPLHLLGMRKRPLQTSLQKTWSLATVVTALERQEAQLTFVKREQWTEEDVVGLPQGEHDFFDRKSGRLFDPVNDRNNLLDNALLGAVAAPLSIAFTLAKAFDVPALSHLRDISYAWALAPLLIWVLVAYVRLHARTAKSALILEDKMRPKLKLGKLNWNSQKVGFDIEIENDSGEHLSNCLVKIEGAKVIRGKDINPAAFPMILLTRGQASRAESGSFNLRPGETKYIGFIYRFNMASGWPALDHEAGTMIFMNVRQCIFNIIALGPPSPTRVRVEIDGDEKGKLTATILDEQPTIPVTSP